MQRLYRGVEGLRDDQGIPWLAKRALKPFYQQMFDQLWMEMLSGLHVLGFSGT